jgi:hypothetical protein
MLYSPLEQFEIYIVYPFSIPSLGLLITNYFLYTFLIIISSCIIGFCYKKYIYLVFKKDYLSTSPKTMSIVPIMVTTSAKACPFAI